MTIIIVSAYRYIATTTLAITAVFLEYLCHFLIDLHQIYSYSYSYRVTLFNELFSEESCSVIGLSEKMGFSFDRNCRRLLSGERRSGGSVFQTRGAATEKLRWPMDVFARETYRSPRSAERSDRRDKSETGRMTCLR